MLIKKHNNNSPPKHKVLRNKTEEYEKAFNEGFDFCKLCGDNSLYTKGFNDGKSFNAEYMQAVGSNWFRDNNIYYPSNYMSINDCINSDYREEWVEHLGEYDGGIIASCIDIIKLVINKNLMNISHTDMMINSQLIANEILYLSSLSLEDRISINEVNKRIDEKVLDNIMNNYDQRNTGPILCSGDGDLKQDQDTYNNNGGMKKNGERMDGSNDYWDI